jgi:transcriptional regulator with XRE-family HTH domain
VDPVSAFGHVLRRVRKQAGLSQEKLAQESEIERNYVSLIERGINQPSVRIIFKLCTALQLKPSQFFALVEEEIACYETDVQLKK